MSNNSGAKSHGLVGRITAYFINSQLTVLLVIALTLFSIGTVTLVSKEENPQINVPGATVTFTYPGAPAKVVEKSVTAIMESRIRELEGIDHIYSTSVNSGSEIGVQFVVGTDWERSIFNLQNQLFASQDLLPSGVTYEVQSKRTDDVPIVTLTLTGKDYSDNQLHRVGERILEELRKIPDTGVLSINGGQPRMIAVDLNPDKLASYQLSPGMIAQSLQAANSKLPAGDVSDGQTRLFIEGGSLFESADDVAQIIVGFSSDRSPIYLRDVATVRDDFRDRTSYSRMHFRPDYELSSPQPHLKDRPSDAFVSQSAITIGIAKKKGTNAVSVSEQIFHKLEELKPELPAGVEIAVTRNDGYTAEATVENLFHELTVATVVVVVMMMLFLGWRDALIVGVVIPLTLGTTIGIGYLTGHTINKVALFALIISIGILVDDGVVVVENIHRRFELKPHLTFQEKLEEAIAAVSEIGAPTVLATFTVVLAFYPLRYITGLVGPYMAPLSFNVPIAMILSLILAITVTPYMAVRMIKLSHSHESQDLHSTRIYRWYSAIMQPLMDSHKRRRFVILTVTGLLVFTLTFPLTQSVKVRVLPKGNDSDFLVQVDAPSGTGLEQTNQIVQEVEAVLQQQPEIINFETYIGTFAPVDFAASFRGTSNRREKHNAEIRVHVTDKVARSITTENLVIQLRPLLTDVASRHQAVVKILEKPAGPPQRATVLAEIYGPDVVQLRELSKQVRQVFIGTKEVVDIDDSTRNQIPQMQLTVDQDKAMRAGITRTDVAQTLNMLLKGSDVSTLKIPGEILPIGIQLRFAAEFRRSLDNLARIQLPTSTRALVPLSELVNQQPAIVDQPIFHKDQQSVVYVTGEMANRSSIYAIFDQLFYFMRHPLPAGYWIQWDGEWKLTTDLFRDIGLALTAATAMIYMLLVGQFHSFKIPLIILGSIPLSLIGILIAFALNGAYFSALSLIGVIALAGMVIRNSIVLLEFIQERLREGADLQHAILEAGAVRFRPILLTSLAAILGNAPILLDPVWAGLGWTIITGMIASSALTMVVIPLIYYVDRMKRSQPSDESQDSDRAQDNTGGESYAS
ncbi:MULTISPECIES: efflux RND transporter permease subunit [Nostoc]|uniref:Efflux RND transporter permease subunit n=1 Tax=Nostoc paludosum FACHB-159 TaxID=2692908 RepID=A0ABR8KK94_9NOSO|nr:MULTISPECIES: efflux RND transporter permease subunit [Nostoc]MBD2682836.1 efflux RND transporter permease subunit [Nostoc sp. FACHB-857]MBD2739171.1 efflux RND transporter permease subunit [Nostoc paludosum FACHB-159]